jgi:hypothetical protein
MRNWKKNSRTYFMRVDMRGLKRGVYAARVTATINPPGAEPARKWFKVQKYRPCYDNPLGHKHESLNDAKVIRLFDPPRRREANP